ncbi:MAG: leucine-rich repeat domain-containing protein [Clostridia bacterium]|nr:leucine-rich repeat domain-containing protein [Clostridia bacterium]
MKTPRLRPLLPILAVLLAIWLLCMPAVADVTIPAHTTVIAAEAFRYDLSLSGTLSLPDGLLVIGDRAFEGCTGLTGSLVIPRGVTTIGSRAFADCTGLTGVVYIPATVTSLADDAFEGTSLKLLIGSDDGSGDIGSDTDLPGGDSSEDDGDVVTMTDLPEGIAYEMTAEGAVITGYSGALDAQLSIPATISGIPVVAIGDYAFQDCYGLTGSVTIPATVRRIGTGAFFGCSSLDGAVSIPAGVEEIGDYAFYECFSLTGGLTLPATVKSVGDSAFAFCESMTGSLSLPASVTLGARCFQGAGFTGSITIPATMDLGANVFVGTGLNVTYEAPGFTYEQVDLVVTLTGWNGPVDAGLTIPSTIDGGYVTGIAPEAFADIGLKGTIVIPSSVVYIGDSAFRSNPGITAISFSRGLQTIAAYAFADCTGLSGEIVLPSTVESLDATAFEGTGVTVTIAEAE